jgi:hypothetical protein
VKRPSSCVSWGNSPKLKLMLTSPPPFAATRLPAKIIALMMSLPLLGCFYEEKPGPGAMA